MPPEGSDLIFDHRHNAALGVLGEPPQPVARLSVLQAIAPCFTAITLDAVKVHMQEAVGQTFLVRLNSLWAAYLEELVHPLDTSGARRRGRRQETTGHAHLRARARLIAVSGP
jgi:hypothetical protein